MEKKSLKIMAIKADTEKARDLVFEKSWNDAQKAQELWTLNWCLGKSTQEIERRIKEVSDR